VYGSLGINTLLPTVGVGMATGLVDGADLGFHYDTHGGLGHDPGATLRLELAEGWAASLEGSYLFYAIEEVGGVEAADAPFGHGLTTTAAIHHSFERAEQTHVALGAGLGVGWTELVHDADLVRQELAPRLARAHFEDAARAERGRRDATMIPAGVH
jgi:hypothetical protein